MNKTIPNTSHMSGYTTLELAILMLFMVVIIPLFIYISWILASASFRLSRLVIQKNTAFEILRKIKTEIQNEAISVTPSCDGQKKSSISFLDKNGNTFEFSYDSISKSLVLKKDQNIVLRDKFFDISDAQFTCNEYPDDYLRVKSQIISFSFLVSDKVSYSANEPIKIEASERIRPH